MLDMSSKYRTNESFLSMKTCSNLAQPTQNRRFFSIRVQHHESRFFLLIKQVIPHLEPHVAGSKRAVLRSLWINQTNPLKTIRLPNITVSRNGTKNSTRSHTASVTNISVPLFTHTPARTIRTPPFSPSKPQLHSDMMVDRMKHLMLENYGTYESSLILHSNTPAVVCSSISPITMQFKLFTLATLATLAVATPTPGEGGNCNTGPVQCCNTVTDAQDPAAAGVLALLGIVLQDLNVAVGLTCSPVTVIGAGGGGCSANPVCCSDNSHGGVISIGCVPVTL
ncbi:hypothetical protein PM082_011839 [Marasmius tenuissimus]|nr:hypothetical protein PM082_011839 [Marasmius tenuissimus]